jgi:hypothetical protein
VPRAHDVIAGYRYDEHTDRALLLRARWRYRGSHAVNLSKIVNGFILDASVPMAVH